MSWQRTTAAEALAGSLAASAAALDSVPTVYEAPPLTLNAPSLVVGRPASVQYSTIALGIDDASVPVICIGPLEGEDVVDGLITFVRTAVAEDPTLGGAVQIVTAPSEQNWRAVRIGGAEFLAADVILKIQM